jgi:hypothetical protein
MLTIEGLKVVVSSETSNVMYVIRAYDMLVFFIYKLMMCYLCKRIGV